LQQTFNDFYPYDADRQKVADFAGRYGDKWSLLVVILLRDGPQRFNAIKRRLGSISQQMLSGTLRNLERDGMVIRTVFPTVPPAVEYSLSDLGHSLNEPFMTLGFWILDHLPQIEDARRRYDERAVGQK